MRVRRWVLKKKAWAEKSTSGGELLMIEIASGDVKEAEEIGGARVRRGVVEVEKWATMVVVSGGGGQWICGCNNGGYCS